MTAKMYSRIAWVIWIVGSLVALWYWGGGDKPGGIFDRGFTALLIWAAALLAGNIYARKGRASTDQE